MSNLKINNLHKSFGSTKVLDNISFDVPEGEFCILLGPSGCGKSTVLRLIAGLEHQDKGEIFIGENEVSNLTPGERDIAMVFQSYALYPHMSVYENMAFSLNLRKDSKQLIDKKVKDTASLLDLDGLLDRKPRELSGGQRQRVAIGRAIVRNPRLFLFDEPLSNLDAKLRSSMRVELSKLHKELKGTTLYVTHDQVEAMTLGEKIVLLDKGKIQQIGTPDELYNKPSNLFVATFIGTPQINLIDGSLEISNNRTIFRAAKYSLEIEDHKNLVPYNNRMITMGIRPESLTPGNGPITGELEFIEHLGPETLIYMDLDGARLTAKAGPDFQAMPGDVISFKLNKRGMHFFHKEQRIDG